MPGPPGYGLHQARDASLQAAEPEHARVTSVTRAAGFAMMPVGALLAGALATVLGVRGALWILTALIAASGLLYLLTPVRHLRDLPQRSQPNPSAHASSS